MHILIWRDCVSLLAIIYDFSLLNRKSCVKCDSYHYVYRSRSSSESCIPLRIRQKNYTVPNGQVWLVSSIFHHKLLITKQNRDAIFAILVFGWENEMQIASKQDVSSRFSNLAVPFVNVALSIRVLARNKSIEHMGASPKSMQISVYKARNNVIKN